jgi:hypothetical protein
MYITKIQKYLSRPRSEQEHNNLVAQINALLDIKYTGGYTYLPSSRASADLLIDLLQPDPAPDPALDLAGLSYREAEEFLRNSKNIQIKAKSGRRMPEHPLWILWGILVLGDQPTITITALWFYQQVFLMYMEDGEFSKAAKVYTHASKIRIRDQPLPILSPYVIQQVMRCNLR